MRVVSLIASSTELVCQLGFEHDLVGRSHECDYPPSIEKLPVCSKSKIRTGVSAREIDRQVRTVVEQSLSVYEVDAEKLKVLNPDVIITQDHCQVCAVSLKDVEAAVCDWLGTKPVLVSLKPDCLSDIWEGFRRVAKVLGDEQKGDELVSASQRRMEAISKKARSLACAPRIACIEWYDPLMAAANWITEFVEMLGAKDLFRKPGRRAPRIRWEDVAEKDPDVIIGMACGLDIRRNREEMEELARLPGWQDVKAVREGRVYVSEGNQFFNRSGPRLVESLEILSEIVYPDQFHFGHEGSGWQRF